MRHYLTLKKKAQYTLNKGKKEKILCRDLTWAGGKGGKEEPLRQSRRGVSKVSFSGKNVDPPKKRSRKRAHRKQRKREKRGKGLSTRQDSAARAPQIKGGCKRKGEKEARLIVGKCPLEKESLKEGRIQSDHATKRGRGCSRNL